MLKVRRLRLGVLWTCQYFAAQTRVTITIFLPCLCHLWQILSIQKHFWIVQNRIVKDIWQLKQTFILNIALYYYYWKWSLTTLSTTVLSWNFKFMTSCNYLDPFTETVLLFSNKNCLSILSPNNYVTRLVVKLCRFYWETPV